MIFAFDSYELDAERQELWRDKKQVKIDTVVVRLLIALVEQAGHLITKDALIERVWEGRAVADNVITVSMARLRKTLQNKRGQGEFVTTVYGRGYRFVCPVVQRDAPAREPGESGEIALLPPPYLGRERLLRELRTALAGALRGHGQLCVLMGEAGIGKTRLVEELESSLGGAAVHTVWAYCRETADTPPLGPFRQVLAELPSGPARDPRAAEPDDALELAALLSEDDPARRRSFEKVLRALTTRARETPLLIVLDDLHRADAASIELLSILVGQIARAGILIVATLRPETGGRPTRPDTQLPYVLGHRNCQRMLLERLSESDVRTYVAALFPDSDDRFGHAVFAKSEGNPFFMVELCRQLARTEAPDETTLTVAGPALDLVREHVAKLDADARGVLSVAAVIGGSFEVSLLSLLTGRHPSLLVGSLDDALAADVIVPAPHSRSAFAFGHELLGTVLYEALPPAERRDLHLRVARALEARAGAGERVSASDLAYHYHAALPETDLRKTVHYCGAAAEEAAAVFASVDVVRYVQKALEALELIEKPSARLRMRLWYFMTVFARGHDGAAYARSVKQLMRIAKEHGDGDMLARAAALLNWHPGLKPLPGESEGLHHALALLPDEAAGPRGVALCALACAAPECFERDVSERLIEEGMPLVRRSGSRAARYAGLISQLYVIGGPDQEERASQIVDELEALARDNPKRLAVLPLDLALYRAVSALTRGDQPTLRAALQRMALHARELHHVELHWHAERLRALADVNGAAREQGIIALRALHAQAARESLLNTQPFCAFDRAVVCRDFVEQGEVPDELLSALAYDPSEPPAIWSMKVRALASAGQSVQARTVLAAVSAKNLAKLPCDAQYLGTLGHLTRAALALGAQDYLRALVPLLERYPDRFAGNVAFLCEGAVPHLLALIALNQEGFDRDRTRAQLSRALIMSEAAGFAALAHEARAALSGL